jgi:hypothetical protein
MSMPKRILSGSRLAIAVAAMTLAAAVPTSAQMGMWGGYGPGMMSGPGFGPGMMGRGPGPGMMMGGCPIFDGATDGRALVFTEGRIAFLKAELGITDAQKSVWDVYADAIKNNPQSMQGMWQMMKTVFEAKTPVERLDAHVAAMESRTTALKAVKPALANLYAALTDEQKRKADELLTGMGCMM